MFGGALTIFVPLPIHLRCDPRHRFAFRPTYRAQEVCCMKRDSWSQLPATGFIANKWYPEGRSTLHDDVHLATFNLAADVGSKHSPRVHLPAMGVGRWKR